MTGAPIFRRRQRRPGWNIAGTNGNHNAEVLTKKRTKSEIVVKALKSKTRSRRFKKLGRLAFLGGLAFFWTSCHHRAPVVPPPSPAPSARPQPSTRRRPSTQRHPPPPSPIVQGEEGIASWYGHPFDGRRAADGEIYDMHAMTAAHRTLPFGTMVRVHDLENGQSVVVRINDRGPFVEGRIIDLSYAAAQAMHMSGTALVRLQILSPGPDASGGIYSVQIGAFLDWNNAERLKDRVEQKFHPVIIKTADRGNGVFNLVLVGQASTKQQAEELASQLVHAKLATQTYVVRTN
jgi:peptidoglycan lytic transglycosylase